MPNYVENDNAKYNNIASDLCNKYLVCKMGWLKTI